MEPEPHITRRRRSKMRRIKIPKPFFYRKIKRLNIVYWEFGIFLAAFLFLIIGLFRNVIWNFIAEHLKL